MTPRLLICGLGQRHRGDDAVGLEVVTAWAAQHPHLAQHPQVRVLALESPGLALLDPLSQAQAALLVDAVVSGAPPGTLHHLTPKDLAAFTGGSASAHGWGLAETLGLAQTLGMRLAPEIQILGIEGAGMAPGAGLSPAIQAAFPQILHAITHWVQARLPTEARHV